MQPPRTLLRHLRSSCCSSHRRHASVLTPSISHSASLRHAPHSSIRTLATAAASSSNNLTAIETPSSTQPHSTSRPISSSIDMSAVDQLVTDQVVNSYATQPVRGVTLRQMLSFGYKPTSSTLIASSNYLYRELLVRMAKRIKELDDLPFGLSQADEVRRIIQHYRISIYEVLSCSEPPKTADEEHEFTERVRGILNRHQDIVVQLAKGMQQSFLSGSGLSLKRHEKEHFLLQEFLDRFNMARIGLRLVMAHHVALRHSRPGVVGVIHNRCSPREIVEHAAADATRVCKQVFGIAPRVNIIEKPDSDLTFRYIPVFLRYIAYELLKNSMRAVVEYHYHPGKDSIDLPDVDVIIVESTDDVVIKICDRGGGIRRSDLPMVFTYTFTTPVPPHLLPLVKLHAREHQEAEDSDDVSSPSTTARPTISASDSAVYTDAEAAEELPIMYQSEWLDHSGSAESIGPGAAMFGDAFGLPLARLYARALGGDVQIFSLKSYGTDAFITCPKIQPTHDTPLPE